MSVSQIVEQTEKERQRRMKRYEEERIAEEKKENTKQFSAEVAFIIKQFEFNCFDIKSTDKKVADFILDRNGKYFITHPDMLPQPMPGYMEVKANMDQIRFHKDEDEGRQHITKSSKFNKWKKALEDKFGVNIIIEREYSYRDRYDNDGYATYPDQIFQGVVAHVSLKKVKLCMHNE